MPNRENTSSAKNPTRTNAGSTANSVEARQDQRCTTGNWRTARVDA